MAGEKPGQPTEPGLSGLDRQLEFTRSQRSAEVDQHAISLLIIFNVNPVWMDLSYDGQLPHSILNIKEY
jgi:hypothetical protein